MHTGNLDGKLAFTVAWETKPGNEDTARAIAARFARLARAEDGLEALVVSQNAADPRRFLFFEVFRDAAAFEAHQQTAHFRTMILEEALPLLAHRERVEYRTV
ncbi:MAG: antibiotic biosynthesis monooxygenase [Proteobacteria bacterium]|nr:antibiotic biosynthesis monooxygenase [Pseudomonadota bacterium]